MPRRVASVTLDNLDDLPKRCRRCVFWELDPVGHARAQEVGDPALEKEAWISSTLLDWGSCGKIVYVDGAPAGYVLYAPPMYVPRSLAFPTSPVSADAAVTTGKTDTAANSAWMKSSVAGEGNSLKNGAITPTAT